MNKTPHQSATLTVSPKGEAKFVGNDALIVPLQMSFSICGVSKPTPYSLRNRCTNKQLFIYAIAITKKH